jgi:hypothetical protein
MVETIGPIYGCKELSEKLGTLRREPWLPEKLYTSLPTVDR